MKKNISIGVAVVLLGASVVLAKDLGKGDCETEVTTNIQGPKTFQMSPEVLNIWFRALVEEAEATIKMVENGNGSKSFEENWKVSNTDEWLHLTIRHLPDRAMDVFIKIPGKFPNGKYIEVTEVLSVEVSSRGKMIWTTCDPFSIPVCLPFGTGRDHEAVIKFPKSNRKMEVWYKAKEPLNIGHMNILRQGCDTKQSRQECVIHKIYWPMPSTILWKKLTIRIEDDGRIWVQPADDQLEEDTGKLDEISSVRIGSDKSTEWSHCEPRTYGGWEMPSLLYIIVFAPLLVVLLIALIIDIIVKIKAKGRPMAKAQINPPATLNGMGNPIFCDRTRVASRYPGTYEDEDYIIPEPAVVFGPWVKVNGKIVPRPPLRPPPVDSSQSTTTEL